MHFMDKAPKTRCVFQVSRPYLGFCPDPKHFIVKIEGNEPTIPKFLPSWNPKHTYSFFGFNVMLKCPGIPKETVFGDVRHSKVKLIWLDIESESE